MPRTPTASWASVDELGRFPLLHELRLTGNPLLESAKAGGRFEVRVWWWWVGGRILGQGADEKDGGLG